MPNQCALAWVGAQCVTVCSASFPASIYVIDCDDGAAGSAKVSVEQGDIEFGAYDASSESIADQ